MSNAMSLKARIRNLARDKRLPAQVILQNYMFERFLVRLTASEYKDKFVLKGGILVAAIVGLDNRATMDLDATLKNLPLAPEAIKAALEKICAVSVDDNVTFQPGAITPIREDDIYGGYRAAISARYDTILTPLTLDISTGDVITPDAVRFSFREIFDQDRAFELWAYNIETVLAEKIETILRRGVFNTRPRDFYDAYILLTTQVYDREVFQKYVVDKLIADNGFETLKRQLAGLLYVSAAIEKRWDAFLKDVKGLGPATISELLTYADPNEYVIFNKTTILCLSYLDVPGMPKYNYQFTGKKYVEVCGIAKEISKAMADAGAEDYDLLAVDYFLWDELLPLAEKKAQTAETKAAEPEKPASKSDYKSLHDEIKEKLVAIGELLGFDSRSEVRITTGAVVDAVWEAKIGNMGKAIYVFEVQSKGSIDSLILNLRKAQSNAAVQAVVAVADEEQLAKIISESKGVIDEKSLRTWDSEDVLAVYDALVRAHESINKLALVPESF